MRDQLPKPRLRVLVIGWPIEQRVALLNQLGYVYRAGGEAFLIVDDRLRWEPINKSIKVIEVPQRNAVTPIDRVIAKTPRQVATAALLLYRARRSPSLVTRMLLGFFAIIGLRRRSRSRPPWWARYRASAFYADTRGWAQAVGLEAEVARLPDNFLDYVLLRDVSAWPVAWTLAQRNPLAQIAASVPKPELADFVAARRAWLRTQPGWWYRMALATLLYLPVRVLRSGPAKWVAGRLPKRLKDSVKSRFVGG